MDLSTIRIQAEAKLWLIIVEAALRRTFAVLVPNNLLVGEGQHMWVRSANSDDCRGCMYTHDYVCSADNRERP